MIPHTPLDVGQLSAAAQRALGPGPGRTMAARGLLPLPPADQVAVLYQLSLDGESNLAQSARATAVGLPEKLLAGTLAAPSIDPRVLDFFADLLADKPAVFDAISLNPAVADGTIATLAGRAGSREVDLIAQNEQRLLRHPEIIAAMYMNRRARMSTIDRVVELAVRNNVRVPGLAVWDEIARALAGEPATSNPVNDALCDSVLGARDDSELTSGDTEQAPDEDDDADSRVTSTLLELMISRPSAPMVRVPLRKSRMVFGSAATADGKVPGTPAQWLVVETVGMAATVVVIATRQQRELKLKETQVIDGASIMLNKIPFDDLPASARIRLATIGDAFIREAAVRDPVKEVAMAAVKSQRLTEIEVTRFASNRSLAADVVKVIADNKKWTKAYSIKVALCRNPKAPLTEVTHMLQFLHNRDLDKILKSRGVPMAVVAQARKLRSQRRGGK